MKAEPALRNTGTVQDSIVDGARACGSQSLSKVAPTAAPAVKIPRLTARLVEKPFLSKHCWLSWTGILLVDGLSLSGGEPMEQPEGCVLLARAARRRGLNIWCWTRFLFEDLLTSTGGVAGVFAGSGCAGGRAVSSLTADAGSPLARDRNQWVIDVKRALI